VRSIKGLAILVAMMLITAGCGARLTKAQLAKAAAGGGQNVSTGAGSADEGAAAGGDQTAAGGSAASGGGGGTAGGAAGGSAGKAAGGGQAQGGAGSCGATGGNSDVGVTADKITLANVSLLTGPVPGLFKGAGDGPGQE